jgi:hypothetical protein
MMAQTGENKAAALGPSKFPWWKDWRGECVALIASGPSTNKKTVEILKGRIHVAAIKTNIDLCKDSRGYWADLVYGCDGAWWKSRNGLEQFKGLKLTYDASASDAYPGLHKVEIDKKRHEILTDEPGLVGSGCNSGFQLLNIVVQFGVTGILLIGFDVDDRSGVHWYGRNNWPGARNPDGSVFPGWRQHYAAAAPALKNRGVDVVNASPASAIDCFRKAGAEETLRQWGL